MYAIHNYGKGKLVGDPNTISDDEHVLFDEYIADSFDELPTEDVKIGDRAIFNNNGSLAIAIYFTGGWVRGE